MTDKSADSIQTIRFAADQIKKSKSTVVLTGAGLSTPSGIPDFRSPGTGLWTRFPPMEVASLSAFRYHPEQFYEWLHPLVDQIFSAQPNPAHYALARLQKAGFISTIITQNIDGLLTRAGATDVLEIHGSLSTLTCIGCFQQVAAKDVIQDYIDHCTVPHCPNCGGFLKPDVILYEEQLPIKTWLEAEQAARNCELMLVIGTSLEVLPSAKLPIQSMDHGAHLIIINHAETFMDVRADLVIHADVAEIMPQIAEQVISA